MSRRLSAMTLNPAMTAAFPIWKKLTNSSGVPLAVLDPGWPHGLVSKPHTARACHDGRTREPVSLRAARGEAQNGVRGGRGPRKSRSFHRAACCVRIRYASDDFGNLLLARSEHGGSDDTVRRWGCTCPLPRLATIVYGTSTLLARRRVDQWVVPSAGGCVSSRSAPPAEASARGFRAAMATTQAGHTVGEIPRFPGGERLTRCSRPAR